MMMPQELKNHNFEHALRGYSTAEVDEYIHFICTKYEELYRTNADLERKLVAALRLIDETRHPGDGEKNTLSEASLRAGKILQEAERQKKRIVSDAEEYADRIIADADAHVAKQAQVLEELRQSVLAFRDELYARYSQQIDQIEELASAVQEGTISVPAPVRGTLYDEIKEPSTPEEIPAEPEAADELPAILPQSDPEPLLVFPLEETASTADDGVDEEELAATDEALAFFEEIADADVQNTAQESEAPLEEDPADNASVHQNSPEPEIVFEIEDIEKAWSAADSEEENAAEEDERELLTDEVPADIQPEPETAEDEFEDEYGDTVIEGGEPIDDDEDPLAGFDERIAALLGTFPPEKQTANDPSDEFSDEVLPITEEEAVQAEEDDSVIVEDADDEQLLRELREAFDLSLEAFRQEDSAEEKAADEAGEKKEEFEFLPEEETEEDEPLSFFERLTGRSSDNKKKDN